MAYLAVRSNSKSNAAFRPANSLYVSFGKRYFDVILALLLLPLVAIFICLIALISGSNLKHFLFAHQRIGRDGSSFACWKIRTMHLNSSDILKQHLESNPAAAEEWRRTQKLQNDPRITPLGRILRRTSLDELPQIWNVLRGEMSFVGPRPITWGEMHHYGMSICEYLSVRPGITGQWQIYGRTNGCFVERVQMDHFYCHAISVFSDLKLLVLTGLVVLRATGK